MNKWLIEMWDVIGYDDEGREELFYKIMTFDNETTANSWSDHLVNDEGYIPNVDIRITKFESQEELEKFYTNPPEEGSAVLDTKTLFENNA